MPMYEYECCGRFEVYLPLKEYDKPVECPHCGKEARKVISANVHGDEAPWIESTNETLTSQGEPRITNRTEWKQRMKERGFVPVG